MNSNTLKAAIIIVVSAVAMAWPFLFTQYPFLTVLSLVIAIIMFIKTKSNLRSAILGYLYGFVFFLLMTSWMNSLKTFGGVWAYVGWLALALYLALAFLFFALGVRVIHRKLNNWTGASIAAALFFVSVEIIRSISWLPYPWGQISIPFVETYPLYKFAALAGWPGMSFMVALISSLIAFYFIKKPSWKQVSVVCVVVISLIVGISFMNAKTTGKPLKAAVIQTNVSMKDKISGIGKKQREKTLKKLVAKISRKTEIAIGPESSLPGFYPANSKVYDRLAALTNADLIIGSLRDDGGSIYNSAIGLEGHYDKNKLLLFGEDIPFEFLKSVIKPLNESLSSGKKAQPLGRIALLICSEAGDSFYAREVVNKGAQIIAVSSNVAWFANSSAPNQHLQSTRLRAIENGRYALMSANYGYSAIIDPDGKILKRTNLGEQKVLEKSVALIKSKTFYTKYGFWTTLLFLIGGLASIIYAFVVRR